MTTRDARSVRFHLVNRAAEDLEPRAQLKLGNTRNVQTNQCIIFEYRDTKDPGPSRINFVWTSVDEEGAKVGGEEEVTLRSDLINVPPSFSLAILLTTFNFNFAFLFFAPTILSEVLLLRNILFEINFR